MEELIKRINELASKKRSSGLTPEEEAEQKELREKYLRLFRQSFTSQLDNTYVVDEKGNKKSLKDFKK